MNWVALRVFLLLVLVASLAIRYQSIQTRDSFIANYNISVAISGLLNDEGLELFENPVRPPKSLSDIVYFGSVECTSRSFVMPFVINNDAVAKLNRVYKSGYTVRYFYLDNSWSKPNRTMMFLSWVKHSVFAIFNATSYQPIRKAIALVEAPDCIGVENIDWRLLWDRSAILQAIKIRNKAIQPVKGELE